MNEPGPVWQQIWFLQADFFIPQNENSKNDCLAK